MKRVSPGLPKLITAALALLAFASVAGAAARPREPLPHTALTANSWPRADAATATKANAWMERAASGWSPNRGQVADAAGHVASNVLFSATVPDAQVYVTTTGISHYFFKRGDEDADPGAGKRDSKAQPVEWARLDLQLNGAVIRADRARLEDPLADQGSTNFYLPHCPRGVLNVQSYGSITFPDVYPGIDWVVMSEPGKGVHHDFVVHPGADVAQVRLTYAGATSIEVSDDQHSVRVRTAFGEVREGALNCYQGDPSNPVAARFHLDGNSVSVLVDSYDRSVPLVIDPPLVWSTYYGGSGNDGPRSIYCDNVNSSVYIVGYNTSSALPVFDPGGGAQFQGSLSGFGDGFIWKFSQLGVRQWATYYGGSSNETNADCTVDATGNLYVCGNTSSTDLPTQPLGGAYNQPANAGPAGSYDGFVLKFNALGVMQWGTYYGGSGDDFPYAITTDAGGKVYVCGASTSPNLWLVNPGGGAYFQNTLNSTEDAFILQFNTLGAEEWGTYFGGTNDGDEAFGIATSANSVYVVGNTQSATFPTLNPGGGAYFQGTLSGFQDAFISRFSLAGVLSWSTYYGGSGPEYGAKTTVDASGNVFLCGSTVSANLPTYNPGAPAYFQGVMGGASDLFLAKFNASNAPVWATYFGGNSAESFFDNYGKPMAVDAQGRVYLTGMTYSTNLPLLNPGVGSFFQGTLSGSTDAILAEFGSNSMLLWSTYFGASADEFGTSVSVDGDSCLFATGESVAPGTLLTVDPGNNAWFQPANAGGDDAYIAKFCTPCSACCLDFTCVAVASQAQCFAMGGTAFFPNQACAATVCNTLCRICGRKFSDLNRNGVQDNGEPGLSGWTIELHYPNGTWFASTTTDASGNYCFNSIACGPWKVNELPQPGWVQTYPPTGSHTLALGTGTTQNGVNFGNYACTTTLPCASAPPYLAAWWPFDNSPGATTAADVTHASPPRNVAQIHGGGTGGAGALCLSTPADYARVPNAGQLGLEFANGSFAIATWINVASSTVSPRMIVEKRARLTTSTSGYATRGWALYLNGLQSYLEIGTGSTPQIMPGPVLTADTWSHLVVSVDRAGGHGRWYLNGSPIAALDFVPLTGLVSSKGDVSIGQPSPPFGAAGGFQGCIGDLSLFSAPLTSAAVSKAYGTGQTGWCPEFAVMPQVTTMCKSQTSAQVCFNICNNNATAQSYHWSLAGLPVGAGCSYAGPTQFSPSAGVVAVPPGSCSPPICVTIQRPVGFTAQNATSCFALTFVNDATGACRSRSATLRADNSCWCATPLQQGVVSVPGLAAGGIVGIGIWRLCDPVATLAYQLRAVWLDAEHPDPLVLRLNGLPPGTPVTGSVTAASGADKQLSVNVSYANGYDPAARYEIVLEADTDGDGVMETLCGSVVEATYDSTERVNAPAGDAADHGVRLLTNPNPFLGATTIGFALASATQVELGVYDLSGRLVRSLARGHLGAGAHRIEWNGRDDEGRRATPGVYFVRLEGGAHPVEAKLVKVQ